MSATIGYNCQNDNMIKVSENTKIYTVAPAKKATGGPELLHQLAYHLRMDLGYNAYMYYYPPSFEDPVHPEYREYENPFVREIIDEPQNILVVPEVVGGLEKLNLYVNIQKVIWWLSVNNFVIQYIFSNGLWNSIRRGRIEIFLFRIINKIAKHFIGDTVIDIKERLLRKGIVDNTNLISLALKELGIKQAHLHLCQSRYAMDFLRLFGLNNSAYLSDYLNRKFLEQNFDPNVKEDIVVFNPKKGRLFTSKIMKCAPYLNFVPIENLPRRGVIELLRKAKVYIDFGDHPGKDRIPREAAMMGCCVIVGKRGSAANNYDMPIPDEYKFEVMENNIPHIIDTIKGCLSDYKSVYHKFNKYREIIRNEPKLFLEGLRSIFGSRLSAER